MRFILLFTLITLSIFVTSCGQESEESETSSSSSSSSSVSNPIFNAVNEVMDTADELDGVIPLGDQSGASANRILEVKTAQGFTGSGWISDVGGLIDERDSSSTSPKEWMGIQLDDGAERTNGSKISPFGVLNSALGVFCAVGVGLGNSSNYPDNGSDSVTLDNSTVATIEAECDLDVSSDMLNQTIGITVEDTVDNTLYDKKITINLGSDQIFYVRSDSSAINIATSEVNENGIHRTVVAYNLSTQVLKLEYVSGPESALGSTDEHISAFRIYHDEVNDTGYMMGMKYDDKSSPEKVHYILAARPESIHDETSNETVALSFVASVLGDENARQACIDPYSGDIYTDNSLACSLTGTDIDSVDTAGEVLVSGYTHGSYSSVSESTTLSFSDSDFATAAFSEN